MSEVSPKVAKPQLRGLLHTQIKKNLLLTGISVVVAAVYMRFVFGDQRKRNYAEFYKNYDIDKEFDRMRNKGLFESCEPDE
ncbi:hypothetical protein NQ315_009741 [Exocentrus adspersus]|uniref:Cytochrome c oxidase subunit 6C n=1 Tax=Exocentrus adspersus TaxID=1586481 RepID=A0AAV8WH62_9CUCU|nr:hypothetical protein NQ315_009741 [Exocentrus adspersus]